MVPATTHDIALACVLLAIIAVARLTDRRVGPPFEGPYRG